MGLPVNEQRAARIAIRLARAENKHARLTAIFTIGKRSYALSCLSPYFITALAFYFFHFCCRIHHVVHLLKDYPEQAVIEAISDLIFRYQEYVQARATPYNAFQ